MVHSLLLLLKGPMQSWGDESRYSIRATGSIPTKSGIVGLIAAAQGRRRSDNLEDLANLRMAVRVDQSGSLLRDYQTAQPWLENPNANAKLITRFFLSDAAFVAAVESEDEELLHGIAAALRNPTYPLFMGRRSCPVHPGLVIGVVEHDAETALREHTTWYATQEHKKLSAKQVHLAIYRDAHPGEEGSFARQDVPLSFAPEHRRYGWREVIRTADLEIENPKGQDSSNPVDPFFDAVVRA